MGLTEINAMSPQDAYIHTYLHSLISEHLTYFMYVVWIFKLQFLLSVNLIFAFIYYILVFEISSEYLEAIKKI